jgi:hypothetical protein
MNLVRHIETSCLSVLSLVNVVDGPFLTKLVGKLANTNILTFRILVVHNLDDSAILDILQVVLRVLEFLEPSSVGRPDLQVSSASGVLDVQ